MLRTSILLATSALAAAATFAAASLWPAPSRAVAARAPGAAASPGRVVRVERAAPEAVEVPAGTFSMGLDPNTAQLLTDNCTALVAGMSGGQQVTTIVCGGMVSQIAGMEMRQVFVSRFAIGRREVTTADYRACVAAGVCGLEPLVAGDERYIRDEWPLVNVTWWEAQEYCRWRGGRLPTEAEWERAARGDDTRAWPWGDVERPNDFNHGRQTAAMARASAGWADLLGDPDGSDGAVLLAPPGSYPWGRGPFGTVDQAGNVAEWTYDAFSQNGYDKLSSSNPVREPSLFDARVVRGGSWRQTPLAARVDTRDMFNEEYLPDTRAAYIGFRCAWDRR